MNSDLLLISAVVVIAVVAWLVRRRRGPVLVDERGVLVPRAWPKPVWLSWDEIESFGVASACQMEGGLYQAGFTQYVGIRLTDLSPKKAERACVDNRRLSDYDVLLSPERKMAVDQFAAFLEREKTKFKKG